MDEILFQVFAESIGRYLDAVDRLGAAQKTAAGTELRRLAAAWRALLQLHEPSGPRRRCAGCARTKAMCTVWRVASSYFVRRLGARPPD